MQIIKNDGQVCTGLYLVVDYDLKQKAKERGIVMSTLFDKALRAELAKFEEGGTVAAGSN